MRIFRSIKRMNYKEFKSFLSKEKKSSDPFVSKIFYRPVSLLIGWFLYRFGISANTVSIVSILIGLLSCLLFLSGDKSFSLFGSILILIIGITDCIDGNIARASNTFSLRGAWLDALSSYLLAAFLPISIGMFAFKNFKYFYTEGDWIIIGALMSVMNILLRLIYQKYSNLILNASSSNSSLIDKNSSSLSLSSEIGLVGWMAPFLIFCAVNNYLIFYLFLYSAFYTFSMIFVIFRLYNKLID